MVPVSSSSLLHLQSVTRVLVLVLVSGGLRKQLISGSCCVSPPVDYARLVSSRQQVPRESQTHGAP